MSARRLRAVASHVAAAESMPVDILNERGPPLLAEKDPSTDLTGCEIDGAAYAANRLTPAERQQFLRDGFIMIDAAVSPDDVGLLTEALDHENAVKLAEDEYYHDSAHPDAMNRMGIFSPANQLSNQDVLQRLLVNDKVLPKIVDVLGWNISIYHAHANRTPPPVPGDVVRDGQFRPVAGEAMERPAPGEEKTFRFHQDSGRVNKELETSDGIVPRLSCKAIFYLTDVEEGMGPTWVVRLSEPLVCFASALPPDVLFSVTGPRLAQADHRRV